METNKLFAHSRDTKNYPFLSLLIHLFCFIANLILIFFSLEHLQQCSIFYSIYKYRDFCAETTLQYFFILISKIEIENSTSSYLKIHDETHILVNTISLLFYYYTTILSLLYYYYNKIIILIIFL